MIIVRKVLISMMAMLISMTIMIFMMILTHSTSGPNAILERRVSHAINDCLTQIVHFSLILASKGSSNRRTIVHPSLKLELTNKLSPIRFCVTLRHLVSTNVWLVQVVYKVNGQLDQKVSLSLRQVRVVEPFIEMIFRAEPQHSVTTILDPIRLLPFLHENRAK